MNDPGHADDRPSFEPRLAEVARRLAFSDDPPATEALDELATLAAAGSPPALTMLLEQILQRRLARPAIQRVLLDPADVADAEQTTLIAVADRIASFEGRARFTTWLGTVARNEALMLVRRRQRKSEPVTDQVPEIDRHARRLSSLIAGQFAFDHALEGLPAEQRTVIELRERDGLSYEEIAEHLGIAVGTVRSRLSRARQTLADQLVGRQLPGVGAAEP